MGFNPGGGGSSSIGGSSDVVLNAPANNDVLSYDSATAKWKNTVAPAATPDANASTKGKIQLAGDLGGTAAVPTVPALASMQTAINAKATPAEWGLIPILYINASTGVWPARTLPTNYSGAVIWDSTTYPDANNPPAAIDGDRWRRRKPAA